MKIKKISIGQLNKNKIIRLGDQGKSLHYIGRAVGLTGERIRQLEKVWGLRARCLFVVARIERRCLNKNCKKIMLVKKSEKRMYCCKKCFLSKFPKKTIAEKRKIWRDKHYAYYHKVMVKRKDFKAYVKRCNDKYQKNKNK
jgi:hypothetical protein